MPALGGEVTALRASPETLVKDFKGLVLQSLDEFTRKVSCVQLWRGDSEELGEELLDAASLAESGVCCGTKLMAVLSTRVVECACQDEEELDLTNEERQVVLKIPEGTSEIALEAFCACRSIQSFTMPSSVTSIQSRAFYGCSSLRSVTIPDSVTTIGPRAFQHCKALTNLEISNSVRSIGDSAFSGCSSLTCVNIPSSVCSIGDQAFEGCSSVTSLLIGSSVNIIPDYAFSHCSSLTDVTLPSSVSHVGVGAFCGCSSLTCVILSSSAKIEEGAFDGCPFTGTLRRKSVLLSLAGCRGLRCTALLACPVAGRTSN